MTRPNPLYRIVKRDVIPDAPWFLLYGGDSADGRGPGLFLGRTVFPGTALTHFRKHIKNNPYSTGYIMAVWPDRTEHVNEEWLKEEERFQHQLRYPKPEALSNPKTKPTGYGSFT